MNESDATLFWRDLQRFGGKVALRRDEVRRRLREFRERQVQLAASATVLGGAAVVLSDTPFREAFAAMAMLLVQTGSGEAWRMRRTGRYWRTWIREPQAPEEIEFVDRWFVRRERGGAA